MSNICIRDYCLNLMGITLWREHTNIAQKTFLLVINEMLTQETQQLLARMLQALKWPRLQTQIEQLSDIAINDFLTIKSREHFKKVLLFGEDLSKDFSLTITSNPFNYASLKIALLPTLSVLLTDVGAKKRAWEIMQKL